MRSIQKSVFTDGQEGGYSIRNEDAYAPMEEGGRVKCAECSVRKIYYSWNFSS
ncbi:Uncharacterised protein [Achromobacter sp. 2789STDY5608633]|jgi:hypothetical protein|nr:Uncharacterised protein [Achromobacter sp. 2789STDY5608633]